jgi:hypothetical protein
MSRQVAVNSNGDLMPQIWMTYSELADLLDCSPMQAGDHVQKQRLDRKRSRDGKTRVKLNLSLTELFVTRIRAMAHPPLDQGIQDLRRVHAHMRGYEGRDRADESATEHADLTAKSA